MTTDEVDALLARLVKRRAELREWFTGKGTEHPQYHAAADLWDELGRQLDAAIELAGAVLARQTEIALKALADAGFELLGHDEDESDG